MGEKEKSEFFKRFPLCRIVPLKEINSHSDYYLKEFLEKMCSANNVEIKSCLKRVYTEGMGLFGIFNQIALIVSRINEDIGRINRNEELFRIATIGGQLTEDETHELDKSTNNVELFCLDTASVLIFVNIFMDKLAKFLGQLIKAEKVRTKNFSCFMDSLRELKIGKIRELVQLIDEHTKWFVDFKDARDDFVVHHPGAGRAIELLDGKAFVVLTTAKGGTKEAKHVLMNSEAKGISIDDISDSLERLRSLLKNLNEFLCENLGSLPIKAE